MSCPLELSAGEKRKMFAAPACHVEHGSMSGAEEVVCSASPTAVIFDMDGLLFDSEALYRDAILAAARELGHRFTAEDFLLLVGRPAEVNRLALQEHIGPAHDVDVFRAVWLEHYRVMKPTLALKPGSASCWTAWTN